VVNEWDSDLLGTLLNIFIRCAVFLITERRKSDGKSEYFVGK
jgi:hypothetical protein